jgi:hypothetical protein
MQVAIPGAKCHAVLFLLEAGKILPAADSPGASLHILDRPPGHLPQSFAFNQQDRIGNPLDQFLFFLPRLACQWKREVV